MAKITALYSLLFLALLMACGKKNKKQYSTWTINGQQFSSNNVSTDIGKARIDLHCDDANRFGFTFNIGYELPELGNYGFEHVSGQSYDSVSAGFYIGTTFYVISPSSNGYISASAVKGKARYLMAPCWFVNYTNAADSVLIEGTFNEP